MKIIYIECDAEDLQAANRTLLDALNDAVSSISKTITGYPISREAFLKALEQYNNDEEAGDDVEQPIMKAE